MAQLKERALRQFTFFKGKSAGRNSAGRITIFHRGGGAKRLRRAIDLKRDNPSVGIVERIEYDPNRSSRIALVRWIQGVQMPRPKRRNAIQELPPLMRQTGEPVAATASGVFSFSSLPGNVDQRKVSCLSPRPFGAYVVVGNPTGMPDWWKGQSGAGSNRIWSNDVALSALSSVNGKGDAESISSPSASCLPRMAVAGAKPAFFAPRMREEGILKETFGLSEVQKWRTDSPIWEHRIKRQAALSWQTLQQQETSGLLVGAAEHKEKPKVDQDTLIPSELLAYALSSGRACYLNASRSLFNVSSPVEASHAGSLPSSQIGKGPKDEASKVERAPVSYITASHQLEAGKMVMNCNQPKPSASSFVQPGLRDLVNTSKKGQVEGGSQLAASQPSSFADVYDMLDFHSQVGNCLPVAEIRMGTRVHNIEVNPGQGAKLARAAGASAKLVKIVKEPALQCLVRLPSGDEKLIDSRCRATIGTVSNPNHGARKLRKAGDSRWLGRRPVVRGVAMNPVDHPHGGGEGRTKGGRPSVSPWGKPTKAGYRTASMKKRKN